MDGEAVASVEFVGDSCLDGPVVKTVSLAFAIRVERRAAIAHLSVALELRVAYLQAIVYIPMA